MKLDQPSLVQTGPHIPAGEHECDRETSTLAPREDQLLPTGENVSGDARHAACRALRAAVEDFHCSGILHRGLLRPSARTQRAR